MKRSGTVASLVVVCLSACSSDDAEPAPPKPTVPQPVTFASGSRLKATFQEVDGVKIFGGWQDTKLGKPCWFAEGRCLTNMTHLVSLVTTFADDTCTTPLVDGRGDYEDVLLVDETTGCHSATLHSIGERVTPTTMYTRNEGKCIVTTPFPADTPYVHIGPAIPFEAEPYVHATEQNDPPDGRIVGRWRVADDGSRELVGAWDSERNEIVVAETATKRWYPAERAALGGDSTCRDLATSFACKPSVVFIANDACRDPTILALGAPASAATCPASYGAAYELGAKIPVKSFADAKIVEAGTGRIRVVMDARDDGRPIFPHGFFDTEAQAGCTPFDAGGTLRCLPSSDSRVTAAFSDAGCTAPAIVFAPTAGACDAAPNVQRYVSFQTSAFEVGARLSAAWTLGAAGCAALELSGERMAFAAAPLDASRLAVVTVRTE